MNPADPVTSAVRITTPISTVFLCISICKTASDALFILKNKLQALIEVVGGRSLFIGIDLGTSGVKALLVDSNGKTVGSADATYEGTNPAPGWSEQNPTAWITGVSKALLSLKKKPFKRI